jgi:hypothetical protein
MSAGAIADADRMAADVFARSYRAFLELKPTHYRWSRLAPQGVEILAEAMDHHWSHEKIADHLNCGVEEAAECARRYAVSKKVNAEASEAARLRTALAEWVGSQPGLEDLGEAEKRRRAAELALIVANHLFAAGRAGDDIMKLSKDLEGAGEVPKAAKPEGGSAPEPRSWGPQWKD